ncbi:DUF4937 domain-containing protein [Bacillus sp. 2205SS5-2]|uniref:DUF4937 domain-containing protein n=1 Tax=Bacillus sp. 2205SS5-2 TaxID=3109031 RepID=UPI00300441F7
MLIKFIRCVVPTANQSTFSTAQQQWKSLAQVSGFIFQCGGWSFTREEAYILGLWEDRQAYDSFMQEQHDAIFDHNQQERTYTQIEVKLISVETTKIPLNFTTINGRLGSIIIGEIELQNENFVWEMAVEIEKNWNVRSARERE